MCELECLPSGLSSVEHAMEVLEPQKAHDRGTVKDLGRLAPLGLLMIHMVTRLCL